MGRTQGFETAFVVRAARSVFWRSGYDEASVPELEQATGLTRSSLYHAFGSKRGLFDAAVQSYLDEVVRPRLAPLTCSPVAPEALADYFSALRAALLDRATPSAQSGCLLVNAAASPIAHDDAVRTVIADYRAELRRAMGAGVDARWPGSTSVRRARRADVLTALIVAALVLARVDPQQAASTIDAALDLVSEQL